MRVAGLLSSQQEANEIQYIARICTLKDRIRFLVKTQKIKELLRREEDNPEE
jgi:hypothetical protein